jgi:hypothetical protein
LEPLEGNRAQGNPHALPPHGSKLEAGGAAMSDGREEREEREKRRELEKKQNREDVIDRLHEPDPWEPERDDS